MLRWVLDTSVIVSGLCSSRGASFVLLEAIARGTLRPLITTALLLEYEDVLKRAAQAAVHGFTEAEIDAYLRQFATRCDPVEIRFRWRPQLRDADDELVLEAAINGRATAIVTHNIRDFGPAATFGIAIIRPSEALQEVS